METGRIKGKQGELEWIVKQMDKTNRKIVQLLWENARISYAEIGKRVHLSAPAVAERVKKMEATGVITGYRVQVDPAAMGYPITAFVLVKVFLGQEAAFATFVQQQPEVMDCYNVTGEKAFLLKTAVSTITQLDNLLERFMVLSETSSMILLSTIVDSRLVI